jgi:protein SCO1/2
VSRVCVLLSCVTLLASCSTGPALPSYGVVPDFSLTDQAGQPFHSDQRLNGHVWVADFIFTNCMGPCPRMSTQMNQIQRALADAPEVRYVSFTIDPDRDTPEVLAQYGRRYKADPAKWHLLTGTRAELRKLNWDTFHLGDVNGQLEHSTRFVLVDAKSRIRGYYDSSEPQNIDTLIADARRLVKGTS